MMFGEEHNKKGLRRLPSLHTLSSRLSLSLIWLALFAYHLTARLRIKYSAFSMKTNMYVRTYTQRVFFSGSIDWHFGCVCVCNVVSSWLFQKSHSCFVSLSVISLSLSHYLLLVICKNDYIFSVKWWIFNIDLSLLPPSDTLTLSKTCWTSSFHNFTTPSRLFIV